MTLIAENTIDARGVGYRELNEQIHELIDAGVTEITLSNVNGQRYIGAGVDDKISINITGTPGNDMGVFMSGPKITVNGNAQDAVANTMSGGEIIIHGSAGDLLGYAMRDGRVFVEGDVGYRVGIHMKEFGERVPVVIAGGTAGDYFGEYMAGGLLVLLGQNRPSNEPLVGHSLGAGMHGGQIFLRGDVEDWQLGKEVGRVKIEDKAWDNFKKHLDDYASCFQIDSGKFVREDFTLLIPVTHRPYGKLYVY